MPKPSTEPKTSKPVENHTWVCSNCNHEWLVKAGSSPVECPECGADTKYLSRKHLGGGSVFQPVWVDNLHSVVGPFVAAYYDKESKILSLNRYHPDFLMLKYPGSIPPKYWHTSRLSAMISHSLTALALSGMEDQDAAMAALAAIGKKELEAYKKSVKLSKAFKDYIKAEKLPITLETI